MLLYVRETLPSVLKKAGYKTIHVGKAHWGYRDTGRRTVEPGIRCQYSRACSRRSGSYHGTRNFSAAFRKGGAEWDVRDWKSIMAKILISLKH